MKYLFVILFFLSIGSAKILAQTDSIHTQEILSPEALPEVGAQKLLPEKMIFTQRLLWGENGLMRKLDTYKLSAEEREKELKIRRGMFIAHQITGYATLVEMLAQGFVGYKIKNGGCNNLKDLHSGLAISTNVAYFTTAGLALFAPPKMFKSKKGFSKIKLHRYLSVIHFAGMIATNILGAQLDDNRNLEPYHRAAAFATFGAMATAMIVIKF